MRANDTVRFHLQPLILSILVHFLLSIYVWLRPCYYMGKITRTTNLIIAWSDYRWIGLGPTQICPPIDTLSISDLLLIILTNSLSTTASSIRSCSAVAKSMWRFLQVLLLMGESSQDMTSHNQVTSPQAVPSHFSRLWSSSELQLPTKNHRHRVVGEMTRLLPNGRYTSHLLSTRLWSRDTVTNTRTTCSDVLILKTNRWQRPFHPSSLPQK